MMNRSPLLTTVALRLAYPAAVALALALTSCSDRLSEERVRNTVPGTWTGTFVPTMGTGAGLQRRMELRVYNNGQYHFLVEGPGGLEIEHAGTWSVHTGDSNVIHLVGSGAPSEAFEVVNLRTLRLYYQGTTVEFTRQ